MYALIVDDDMATVDVIRDQVSWETLGIRQVYTAYNIHQAKEILKANDISIIISDIEMPQGSGIELLTWFREQKLLGEFLLLTCHESFDYAANAIKLQAAEYLLKPFDVAVMEAALKKIVLKIMDERKQQEEIRYGRWAQDNQRQIQLAFWQNAIEGKLSDHIAEEIRQRNLEVSAEDLYCLSVSKIMNLDKDRSRIHASLLNFIFENIHSEILCGTPENSSVISMDFGNYMMLVSVCSGKTERECEELGKKLIWQLKQFSAATATCCISSPCKIEEFYAVFRRIRDILDKKVAYHGTVFLETSVSPAENPTGTILDEQELLHMIEERDKIHFMTYLKAKLNERLYDKTLSEQMLLCVRQEIQQAVFTYFARKEIPSAGFFLDEAATEMTNKASQSVIDMLRWAAYLLEQIAAYENELRKGQSVIDKINQYIHEHYKENIGRNEIAEQLFLSPEYVSKLYKKETGISLKEYIGEYRIEQAKRLLANDAMRISEVAEETGFENFTYFSTMFKKYTGMTPNQFRKK